MTDFSGCSHELLAIAQHLDGLLGEVRAAGRGATARPEALPEALQTTHSRMAAIRTALLADADRALSGEPEIESVEDGVAASRAAAALEPGYRALQDLAGLIGRAPQSSPGAGPAFIERAATALLSIGLRQCLAALAPLAERLVPPRAPGGASAR